MKKFFNPTLKKIIVGILIVTTMTAALISCDLLEVDTSSESTNNTCEEHTYNSDLDEKCSVCGEIRKLPFSKGLKYGHNSEGDLGISGIGTCTDVDLVIPSTVDGEDVKIIFNEAFKNCTTIKSIKFSNTMTIVGNNAFEGCTGLTSLSFPESAQYIGNWAFADCKNLKSVDTGNGMTQIGENAFFACSSLSTIKLGANVTTIGAQAFSASNELTAILIPKNVVEIGPNVFSQSNNLKSVVFEDTTTWYRTHNTFGGTTRMDVTDSGLNAINMRDTYAYFTWKKV